MTNVMKPNAPDDRNRADVDSYRHANLGGAFHGHFDKVVRNKRASIIWEARFSFKES